MEGEMSKNVLIHLFNPLQSFDWNDLEIEVVMATLREVQPIDGGWETVSIYLEKNLHFVYFEVFWEINFGYFFRLELLLIQDSAPTE